MKNTVKITLKYDDGKEKVTLEVDADEMEICLENDYQHRLSVASPEERATVRKYTPAEFADRLNKDSYNNWHTENRRTASHVKNPCADEGDDSFINPMDMIPATQKLRLPDFESYYDRRPMRDSVMDRDIRKSRREDAASRRKPRFRITERIDYDRRRLTENRVWEDRVDELTPDVIEWRNTRTSYRSNQ